jgi:pimeloyl-ACP methyl ester carboxylesterase
MPSDATTPPPPTTGPRFLYLHGFASSPASAKGLAFVEHFAPRGLAIQRLDLRLPSLERLRLSAGIQATRDALGGPADRAVLIGSSLGGLTAARVAAIDARACALVLMAPAFCLAERWRARLGEADHRRWRETGWLEIDDHATRQRARVHHGFLEEASAIDQTDGGWPDVRVPTLILHGRQDEVVDIALSRTFAAGKRHVRLVELDDGHELTATLPRILEEATAFLTPFLGSPA